MNRIELLIDLMQKHPKDVFLHYAMAMEYMSSADFQLAISKLLDVKTLENEYLPLYYQLGKCFEHTNQNQLAQTIYEEGIEIALQQKNMKTASELRSALEEIE
jgi:tetratricopeptide (TPR) repeat protein